MLKANFKNNSLLKLSDNSRNEIKSKLSKILIQWFLTKRSFKIYNINSVILGNFTIFVKNFIKAFMKFRFLKFYNLLNYRVISEETNQFVSAIININKLVIICNSENLILFNSLFFEFYWFLNTDLRKYNRITIELLKTKLFFKLNHRIFAYFNKNTFYVDKITCTKIKSICFITGRNRAVIRSFKLSRFKFREIINEGLFIGLTKSSW